jgi:hypothetical protein
MGITGLIDNTNRVMQGRDTSVDSILNCQAVDLNGNKFTVTDRETIKTMMVVQNLDPDMRTGLTNITTPGLMSDLRKQGYGFHRTEGDQAQVDITKIYKDADGTRIIEAANYDEDRSTFFKSNLQKHTEIPFGDINPDDLQWRNLPGSNGTGSRNYYRMWGTSWTMAITSTLMGTTVKRASTTGITTQVVTGMGN